MQCGWPRTPAGLYGLNWVEDVGGRGKCGDGGRGSWAVRLAAGLVISCRVLEHPLLVIGGFGPELVL